ncbi:hypothetical protein [Paraburkholderia bannensis]|uniref:hypothetical protein n=1 Tax=Paraburkholderia bannensis TaxID=765414 RepID=UPI0004832E4E|nr:hypothetical protein [Paraburkholderia bannensis]
MKRILFASFALFACTAAFAQETSAPTHHRHHSGKHHHTARTTHHAYTKAQPQHNNDSVADRAQPLESADFKP